jgi:hypothetical protein
VDSDIDEEAELRAERTTRSASAHEAAEEEEEEEEEEKVGVNQVGVNQVVEEPEEDVNTPARKVRRLSEASYTQRSGSAYGEHQQVEKDAGQEELRHLFAAESVDQLYERKGREEGEGEGEVAVEVEVEQVEEGDMDMDENDWMQQLQPVGTVAEPVLKHVLSDIQKHKVKQKKRKHGKNYAQTKGNQKQQKQKHTRTPGSIHSRRSTKRRR